MAGFDFSCVKPIYSVSGVSIKDILSVHKDSYVPVCYISRGNEGTLSGVLMSFFGKIWRKKDMAVLFRWQGVTCVQSLGNWTTVGRDIISGLYMRSCSV